MVDWEIENNWFPKIPEWMFWENFWTWNTMWFPWMEWWMQIPEWIDFWFWNTMWGAWKWWMWPWWFGQNINDLKTKIMANEELTALYNSMLEERKEKIFSWWLATELLNNFADVFYNYEDANELLKIEEYTKDVENIKSYIEWKMQ